MPSSQSTSLVLQEEGHLLGDLGKLAVFRIVSMIRKYYWNLVGEGTKNAYYSTKKLVISNTNLILVDVHISK